MKARVAFIKEHFMKLCEGDLVAALLLDRLLYYAQQNEQMFDLIQEEIDLGTIPKFEYRHLKGWVRKSAAYLADSLLIGETDRTVQRKLTWLADKDFIMRRRHSAGSSYEFRPNFRKVEEGLLKHGFDLEGNSIVPTDGGVEVLTKPPSPDPEHEKSQQEAWNSIPGAPSASDASVPTLAPKEWHSWAARHRTLDHAPEDIRKASWVVNRHTGFEPDNKKDWLAGVMALWEAAGRNEEVLVQALEVGQKSRMNVENHFTFAGPRSYVSFARDARAKANLKLNGGNTLKVNVKGGSSNGVIKVGQHRSRMADTD